MAKPEILSVRAVAAQAGVSPMTASRVLRGDKCVTPARRARVLRAAAVLGYHLNPAVSSLMSHIRRRRVAAYRGKIAWLNSGPRPRNMDESPWDRPLYEGVRQRAEQYGYILDDVWLNDPLLRPDQINDMLIARGIHGLIISNPHPCIDRIQWKRFASATTMTSPLAPPVYLAGTDFMHGVREAFSNLRRHGYGRIGLVLHPIHDQSRQGLQRAGYLLETSSLPAGDTLPVLLLPNPYTLPVQSAAFGNWLQRHHPDAVICSDEHVLDWALSLGIAVPNELGLVHLNRHHYLKQWAGIDQRENQIGVAVVDLVVEQINRGEYGLPPSQKEVLIKGEWVEGPTLRPLTKADRRPA